jgi:hypothetical protein
MFQLPNGQRIVSVAKVGADDIDDAEIVTPLTDLDGEGEVAENVE